MTSGIPVLWAVLLFVALQVVYALLIRTFPDLLGAALLKKIEQHNAAEIEKLKNDLSSNSAKELEHLRADYQTLRDSTEYLASNQTELRAKMIASAETLWAEMLTLRNEFSSLITFELILVPSELGEAFEKGNHPKIMRFVDDCRDEEKVTAKLMKSVNSDSEKARLFAGDKLWLTYYVFRATILRIAYLTSISFKEKKYRDWRKDQPSLNLLSGILGRSAVDAATMSQLPSLSNILASLEAEYLAEAMRIMSGSKVYADSIADVRSTMAYETARARAQAGF